jgi:hypothetical protein
VALFVLTASMLGTGVAAAQADLAKVLVGTWQGELQMRMKKGPDPTLALIISSVKQEDGKWVAEGRLGATAAKTGPVKMEVDTSGAKPSLRWKGRSGTEYDLNLIDDSHLVGTATLTTQEAGRGPRERTVRLEKKQ